MTQSTSDSGLSGEESLEDDVHHMDASSPFTSHELPFCEDLVTGPDQESDFPLDEIVVDANLIIDEENDVRVKCLISTGAHKSTIRHDLYHRRITSDTLLRPTNRRLVAANRMPIAIDGVLAAALKKGGVTFLADLIVSRAGHSHWNGRRPQIQAH